MNSVIIMLLLWFLSYIFDKAKKDKKNNNKQRPKIKKVKPQPITVEKKQVGNFSTDSKISKSYNTGISRKRTQIVDRESEIFSNSQIIDKDKIVNDIIFSEILSKPKSKR